MSDPKEIFKPVPEVVNNDSRLFQPLPWHDVEEEKYHDIIAYSDKIIAMVYGNDTRHPKNMQWCTEVQRRRHVKYILHACNSFPLILKIIEMIYNMEDMPEEAIKAIETMMDRIYLPENEMPAYIERAKR